MAGIALAAALAILATGAMSSQGAPSATLTRPLPPSDGRAYFGCTYALFDTDDPVWGDDRPFAERIADSIRVELAGKTPAFIKVWAPWQHPDLAGKPYVPFSDSVADIAKVNGVTGAQGLLHLDWNLTLSTGANEGLTTRDVRRGAADRYIRAYARDVRDYGRPILMTLFNGEFNGDWWWGVSPRANRLLTTEDFVVGWRRVVDIFRAVGATNVSWAWVVNGYVADPSVSSNVDRNIGAYYPGDGYVDWVGADVYDVGAPSWLDGPYGFAVAHGKPMFIGEFGIRHEWSSLTPPQHRAWLEAMFDYFESHQAIKAISYFNLNNRRGATHVQWDPARDVFAYDGHVRYTPDRNDHDSRLIAGGPQIRAIYSRRISAGRYQSAVSTEDVASVPQPAAVQLLAPIDRGKAARVRWSGNLAAHTFDLAVKTRSGGWKVVATRLTSSSYRLRGAPGTRARVKVRGRTVDEVPGTWSGSRIVVFR
jgi:hypothetical protein